MNKEFDRVDRLMSMERMLGRDVVERLIDDGFTTAPASAKFHGAYDGGLIDHSFKVTERLIELTKREKLKWGRKESPYIVGMLHDLCKIDQYEKLSEEEAEAQGKKYKYRQTEIDGHGSKSVIYAGRLIELTEEEELCIRYHMGAFTEKEEWSEYTGAIHKYPNVFWTHNADMIASHIDGV